MAPTATFSPEQLIKTELPALPLNVLRIRDVLSDVNASQKAVTDAIARDPVLATRVLRLANSAYFAGARSVANLSAAISVVGNQSIADTALMSGLGDAFGRRVLNSAAGREIWTHLLSTGMAASDLCNLARLRGVEEAFSCGLLHDIGKLIFLRADAPTYMSLVEHAATEEHLAVLENETFGIDHAELGARAAEAWNLPAPVCSIIGSHHDPEHSAPGVALARMLRLGDDLAYRKVRDLPIDDLASREESVEFGLTAAKLEAIWEDVVIRLEDMAKVTN